MALVQVTKSILFFDEGKKYKITTGEIYDARHYLVKKFPAYFKAVEDLVVEEATRIPGVPRRNPPKPVTIPRGKPQVASNRPKPKT